MIMHAKLKSLALVALLLAAAPLRAAEFYVAPTGKDTAAGTIEQPYASLTRAQEAASPGDTVWIRGGDYIFSGTEIPIGVTFNKSGAEGRPIRYFAYKDEVPVFDFFQLKTLVRIKGFSVTGSWLHFRGIEMKGIQQTLTNVNESWCIRNESGGSHNIYERLNLHHNQGPGFFIADGGHNLVLNCDSHHNYDPARGGGNGDGFGGHSKDDGNIFRGCRAWNNSDDGYDFINSPGVETVEYSWSWHNGYIPDTEQPAGNGAGFKAGGFGLNKSRFPAKVPRHVVRFNVAFMNRAQGFYANHHPGGIDWYNNTAFNNPVNFDMLADVGAANHLLRNNLAFGRGGAVGRQTQSEIDDQFNAWNSGITITEADFVSVSPAGVDGPRQPDGSMPKVDFLKLAVGSKLIDAGKEVGLPFKGKAPDFGANEFGESSPTTAASSK